jgi:arsenate reductase-like glutaredoxin family protein
MRFIAKKLKDFDYELTGIEKAKTPKGKEVEIVVGKVTINVERLKDVINQFEEETEFFVNQRIEQMKEERNKQLNELKAELEAIEKLGK